MEVRVSRVQRLLLFGAFAGLAVFDTGCCCVRQRIAARWQQNHGAGGACCAPAFRIPSPLPAFAPVGGYPVAGGPAAGCASCAAPFDGGPPAYHGAVSYGGPASYGGPIMGPVGGPPVITSPMPLLPGPRIEPVPTPMPPPKTGGY